MTPTELAYTWWGEEHAHSQSVGADTIRIAARGLFGYAPDYRWNFDAHQVAVLAAACFKTDKTSPWTIATRLRARFQ